MPEDNVLVGTVADYVEECRLRVQDGLTISEVTQIVLDGMRLSIALLDSIDKPGTQKASDVVAVALWLFDEFADLAVPGIARPIWWLLRPSIRSLVASLAAGAIESLLPLVRAAE